MFAVGLAGVLLGGLTAWAWLTAPREKSPPLPATWALSPRLVFNVGERRLYRQLKTAFPNHVVMPKLPLVRLCQPKDLGKVHYWYGLLGSTHVTFAICSPNGKALLAVDLESRRSRSKRTIEIKESVLATCGVKYFSMAADGIPTADALRLLMPRCTAEAAPVDAAPVALVVEGEALMAPVSSGPVDHSGKWRDPSVFLDSFFAPDSRLGPAFDAESSQAWPDPTPPASGSAIADPSPLTDDPSGDVAHLEFDGPDSAVDWRRQSDVGGIGGVVVDDDTLVVIERSSAAGAVVR
ncbi:MAG: DUF2726 domain-containing protein [Pseudomonadota bacterium]|nr:DUF2726 domain-containing protein [Pseudomonadota bacterium]